jgi:hypothetical protein
MMSTKPTRTLLADSSVGDAADADRVDPVSRVWHGFLDEFRNHLTVLAAATDDAVFETERKVRGLTSLVALVDASSDSSAGSFEPVIATLGAIVDRAVRLAAPASGPRTSIVLSVPRASGVRSRGAALECLLAALIIDLARAPAPIPGQGDFARAPLVRVDADLGRRGLAIEVSCDGARLDRSIRSWRFDLASELAAKLGATLTVVPEISTYVVQFSLTSS